MDAQTILALGVIAPVAAVLVLLGAAYATGKLESWFVAPSVAATAAVVGSFVVLGWPRLPPPEATHWVAPAALVGLAAFSYPYRADTAPKLALYWAVLATFLAASGRAFAGALFEYTWTDGQGWLHLGPFAVLGASVWLAAHKLSASHSGKGVAGYLAIWAGVTGILLASTGSLKFGQLGGALGAGLGAYALAGVAREADLPSHSAIGVVLPVQLVLLASGVWYSEMPLAVGLCLGLAPPRPRRHPLRRSGLSHQERPRGRPLVRYRVRPPPRTRPGARGPRSILTRKSIFVSRSVRPAPRHRKTG